MLAWLLLRIENQSSSVSTFKWLSVILVSEGAVLSPQDWEVPLAEFGVAYYSEKLVGRRGWYKNLQDDPFTYFLAPAWFLRLLDAKPSLLCWSLTEEVEFIAERCWSEITSHLNVVWVLPPFLLFAACMKSGAWRGWPYLCSDAGRVMIRLICLNTTGAHHRLWGCSCSKAGLLGQHNQG